MTSLIKHPSAWLPIVLSLIMMVVFIFFFVTAGVPQRQADEGAGAHLFQIWLVLEIFMIPFFAFTWVPKMPREAFMTLAIQILLVLVVCSPVYFFHL